MKLLLKVSMIDISSGTLRDAEAPLKQNFLRKFASEAPQASQRVPSDYRTAYNLGDDNYHIINGKVVTDDAY